jgi:hypothetical protein
MQEYTQAIHENLVLIYEKLDRNLSLNHIGFDIDYGPDNYLFYAPTTKKEKREQEKLRKKFIKKILKQALKEELDSLFFSKPHANIWDAVVSFSDEYLSNFEPVDLSAVSQAYQISDETTQTKSKALDLNSQYVFFERPDLTQEMIDEFFASKSRNDSMSGENSSIEE